MIFDTDLLPERDRFPAFCEEFVRRRTALDIVPRSEVPFRGLMDIQRAGPVVVCSHFSTPASFIRSAMGVRDGDDSLVVTLCRRGVVYLTQYGSEQKIEPGSAAICDSGYPGEACLAADSLLSLVRIPRALLAQSLPSQVSAAGLLDRDDVARRLLFSYLDGTHDIRLEDSDRAAQLYGEHIVDLIALAIGANGEAGEIAEQRGGRAARLMAILRIISQQFGNPRLDPAAVAAQLGITPRYLHMLLEGTDCSFAQRLLEQRLEQAAALLRDPRQRGRKITDIAQETGFADLSYFNRAFRRRFGDTPSGVRGTAFRNPHHG